MAEEQEMRARLSVDVSQATQGIQSLEKEMRQLKTTMSEIANGKKIIGFDTDAARARINELEQKIKDLNNTYASAQQKLADQMAKGAERAKAIRERETAQAQAELDKRIAKEEAALQKHLQAMERASEQEIAAEERKAQRLAQIEAQRQRNGAKQLADEERLQAALQKMNNTPAPIERVIPVKEVVVNSPENIMKRAMQNAKVMPQILPMQTYDKEMGELNQKAQSFYRVWKATGDETARLNFTQALGQLSGLNQQATEFRKRMGVATEQTGLLNSFLIKAHSHMNWIISGSIITGISGAIAAATHDMVSLESAMAGVAQVMPDIENNMSATNKELNEFLEIGSKFGAAANDIIEGARAFGRMYGQGANAVANVNLLTKQAVKMAVADNFDITRSVKGLESALSQYNMVTSDTARLQVNTNRILDVWTTLAHKSAASAQDLTEGVALAGSAAYQAGISFEFLNALIATGIRDTGRSGNEIGNALKSMITSMQGDKATKALQDFGIQVYKTTATGKKEFRNMQDIILDTALAIQTTNKDTGALMATLAGGKFQVSKVSAILHDYKELLRTYALANDVVDSKGGFTDKQVGIQMETVSRRLEGLKNDFKELAVAIGYGTDGTNGMINDMKYLISVLSSVIRRVTELKSYYSSWITVLVGAIVIYKGFPALVSRLAFAYGKMRATGELARRSHLNLGAALAANFKHWTSDAAAAGRDSAIIAANTKAVLENARARRSVLNVRGVQDIQGVFSRGSSANRQSFQRFSGAGRVVGGTASASSSAARATNAAAQATTKAGNAAAQAASKMDKFKDTMKGAASSALSLASALVTNPYVAAALAIASLVIPLLDLGNATETVAEKQQKLKDSTMDTITQATEMAEQYARQEQVCENLADKYNKLKEAIDSGKLSEEQAAKTREEMGAISDEVAAILHTNSDQFIDDTGMNKNAIKQLAAVNKQEAKQKLEDEKAKLIAEQQATDGSLQGIRDRITGMQKEAEACQSLGAAWTTLYSIIADVYEGLGKAYDDQIKEIEELKANGHTISAEVQNTALWASNSITSLIFGTNYGSHSSAEDYAAAAHYRAMAGDAQGAMADISKYSEKIGGYASDLQGISANIGVQIGNIEAAEGTIDSQSIEEAANNPERHGEVDDDGGKKKKGSGGSGKSQAERDAERAERQQKKLEEEEKKRYANQIKAIETEASAQKKLLDEKIKTIEADERAHGVTEATTKARDKALNDYQWAMGELARQAKEIKQVVGDDFEYAEKGAGEIGQKIVAAANTYLGDPYVYGGESHDGIDCSGLVQAVFKEVGIDIARTADAQAEAFDAKGAFHYAGADDIIANAKAGDAIFMRGSEGSADGSLGDQVGHVGIYIGNGQYIQAPKTGDVVKVSNIADRSDIIGYGDVGAYSGLNNDAVGEAKMAGLQEKLQDAYIDAARQRSQLWFDSTSKMIETATKLAEFKEKAALAKGGIDITQAEKDDIAMDKAASIEKANQHAIDVLKEHNLNKADDIRYQEAVVNLLTAQLNVQQTYRDLIDHDYEQAMKDVEWNVNMEDATAPQYKGLGYSRERADFDEEMAQQKYAAALEKVQALENEKGFNPQSEAYRNAQLQLEQALQNLKKVHTAYRDSLRQGAYELTNSLIIQGNSLKQIWTKLWNELADDALKAIFRINNDGNVGFLSKLLGFGRGTTSTTLASSGGSISGGLSTGANTIGGITNFLAHGGIAGSNTNYLSSPITGFAAHGTVTDKPVIAGEDGEEVIIPVEKNKENSLDLLSYAARKLGTSTAVQATVSPQTAQKAEAAVKLANTNAAYVARMDKQNQLMEQQNSMILHMLNNGMGGGNGGSTVVQPVIMRQTMSSSEFGSMYTKAMHLRQIKS